MIYLTGDLHGPIDINKLSNKNWKEAKNATSNDYLIILGDFGLIFEQRKSAEEKYWLNWLTEKPWTTLFIDGNHENFNRLAILEDVWMFGNRVGKVTDKIFHLKRGIIYTIEDHTFFTFGGAQSIDKHMRTPHVSWWPQEEPSYHEFKRGLDNLEKAGYKVDYILTHDTCTSMLPKLVSMHTSPYQLTEYLEEIFKRTEFKHHYFGHHHNDKNIDEKHTLLYKSVIKLRE